MKFGVALGALQPALPPRRDARGRTARLRVGLAARAPRVHARDDPLAASRRGPPAGPARHADLRRVRVPRVPRRADGARPPRHARVQHRAAPSVHDGARRADRRPALGRSLRVRHRRVVARGGVGRAPASTSRHAAGASTRRSRSASASGPRRRSRTTASSSRSTRSCSNRSRCSNRGRRSSSAASRRPRCAARRASATAGSAWATRSSRPRRRSTTLRALLAEHGRDREPLPDRARRPGRVDAPTSQRWEDSRRDPHDRLAVAPFEGSDRRPGRLRGAHLLTRAPSDGRRRQSASRRSGCAAKSRIEPTWRNATSTMPGCIVWQTPRHRSRELGRDRHARRGPCPRPIPMSHARRSAIAHSASSSGSVASAQRMNPPRHGAASNGGSGSTIPFHVERPRRARARRRPTAARASRRSPRSRGAGSRRRTAASTRPRHRAACVIAWHAASNWCVQFCFGSVHAPAAVNRSDSGMPASCRQRTRPRPGRSHHGQRCDARRRPTAPRSPSWRSVTTKWWKSSSSSRHDDARFDGLRPGSGAGRRRPRGRSRVGET